MIKAYPPLGGGIVRRVRSELFSAISRTLQLKGILVIGDLLLLLRLSVSED